MPNNTPNYESMGLPGLLDLMKNLGSGQDLLAGYEDPNKIAQWFGLDDKYGKYFSPVNMGAIKEGLGQIPELQNFLYKQNRNNFSQQQSGLLNSVGKTGLAGTGSFDNKFDAINSNFSNKMFSSDKQIQDLVQGYQNQLNSAIQGMFSTAGNLVAGGAKIDDENKNYNQIQYVDNPEFQDVDPNDDSYMYDGG